MFGEYCEVHDEPDPTNTQVPRTHEALALGPTGNSQGTVKFSVLRQDASSNEETSLFILCLIA